MQLLAVLGRGPGVASLGRYRDPDDRFRFHAVPNARLDEAVPALVSLGFAGALIVGEEARAHAARMVHRTSIAAHDLAAVNAVRVLGTTLHGDHVGSEALVDGLRHAGWDPQGARVVAFGSDDDVRSLLSALAAAGVREVTLVASDGPEAERRLPRLAAGVTTRALARRDPAVTTLIATCDLVLRGGDGLPLDLAALGPHLTVVDLVPDLAQGTRSAAHAAGATTVGWADVEAHRVAARVQALLAIDVDPTPFHDHFLQGL